MSIPGTGFDDENDCIELAGLRVDCVIGVYPEERLRLQPLLVDIRLSLDLTKAARSGKAAQTIDYAALAREIAYILEAGKFELLETAALALLSYVLEVPRSAARPAVKSAWVKIKKPEALASLFPEREPPRPSVSLQRQKDELPAARLEGDEIVLFEGGGVSLRYAKARKQGVELGDGGALFIK
jgi:dihydroneopterin aldolase